MQTQELFVFSLFSLVFVSTTSHQRTKVIMSYFIIISFCFPHRFVAGATGVSHT